MIYLQSHLHMKHVLSHMLEWCSEMMMLISIQYTDGKIYTVHKDGTWMFSEADGSMITVEREGYSTVKVWVGVSNTENIEELEVEEKKALDDYIL